MTFWTALRWVGALIFCLIVLVSWLGAGRNSGGDPGSEQPSRPAPIIVR